MLYNRSYASEDDLRPYQQLSIETTVSHIIVALNQMEGACTRGIQAWSRNDIRESHKNPQRGRRRDSATIVSSRAI